MHAHLMNTLAQTHRDDLRRMAAVARTGDTPRARPARRRRWLADSRHVAPEHRVGRITWKQWLAGRAERRGAAEPAA